MVTGRENGLGRSLAVGLAEAGAVLAGKGCRALKWNRLKTPRRLARRYP